jgi:hypothetical protein
MATTASRTPTRIITTKLTRLAFQYAEQDRLEFLDAISHIDDLEQEKAETRALIAALHHGPGSRRRKTTAGIAADKLTCLAFVYAEQDRLGYLDAIRHTDLEQEKAETRALIAALRRYRRKRWGKTEEEDVLEAANGIDVFVLKKRVCDGDSSPS